MAKKKTAKGNTVAQAAAAAATAAVNAAQQADDERVWLFSNDGEPDDDDDDDLHDEIMDGLAQLDESAAGDIVWWELYCDSPLEKAGLVRKMSTAELKGLRTECLELGPGEYHVIARAKRGRFVKNSRHRVKISGFARPGHNAAAPAAPAMDPMLVMSQMEERLERRRLAARAERMAEIKFWAPILAPIGIELAKGLFGRSNGDSLKDLVGALVGVKDLVGGGGNQVDTLLKGIELARDLESPKSNGSTWPDAVINGVTSIAKEFRPLAESIAAKRGVAVAAPGTQLQYQPAAAAPAAALPAGSSGGAQPAAPGAEQPTQQGDEAMFSLAEPILRGLSADLEQFAVNATDPVLAADALLAKVPRTVKAMVQPEKVKEWLSRPDWWEFLVRFHPPLQPYQAFCDDVRLALLEAFDPQPDDEAQE